MVPGFPSALTQMLFLPSSPGPEGFWGLEPPHGSDQRRQWHPHSSTLAWKIPWMEEPGGLQSMGSLRVGHD